MHRAERRWLQILIMGIWTVLLCSCSLTREVDFPGENQTLPQQESIVLMQECEVEFEDPLAGSFAYDSLTKVQRLWYQDINETLGNMQKERELSAAGLAAGLTQEDIDLIFQCVLNDHPEYFYVEGYTYTSFTRMGQTVRLVFDGTYSMDRKEALIRRDRIRENVDALVQGMAENASDYEKIKYVYETLIRNTDYDLGASDSQNIYSVFVNHSSVCQGYAKATQYLLNRLGVECTLVTGTVDTGESHAWNLVKADGSFYYVDTTWGDASYLFEEGGQEKEGYLPQISYDYLCITTRQLLRTHTLGGVVPMPFCESLEDNYYVREGLYFTQADKGQLAAVFESAAMQGREDVTIKCADSAVYEALYEELVTRQGVFTYLDCKDGQIAYAQNEKQLSMTFWMTNE